MKLVSCAVLIAAWAVPAFCQEPSPSADTAALMAEQAEQMAAKARAMAEDRAGYETVLDAPGIAALEAQASALAEKAGNLNLDDLQVRIDSLDSLDFSNMEADIERSAELMAEQAKMAFLQAPQPKVLPDGPQPNIILRAPRIKMDRFGEDGAYDEGARALDEHKYDEAVQHFDTVITAKSTRADGALYWKAYALNREGKRDEALAALTQLRTDYPSSAWLHDAQALQDEVKRSAGQPISPEQESNDDLKLMAINSLMNADAERAIPLLEGILKGNAAPNVKERALFVLAQSKSPRAQQVLTDYAKGAGNPDLQLRAIRYVGMSGTKEAQQQLAVIYAGSGDVRLKASILQSLMIANATDALMSVAKTEKDATLRDSAIRDLASNKAVPTDGLMELYGSSDAQAKRSIVDGLASRRDAKTLVDLVHRETDPTLKRAIVERLGGMHDNKEAMDYMMELLK